MHTFATAIRRQNGNAIADFAAGKSTHIALRNFVPKAYCDRVIDRLKSQALGSYAGVYPRIGKIGPAVFEYKAETKADYFKAVLDNQVVIDRLFFGLDNPNIALMKLFSGLDRRSATDPDFGTYGTGIVRAIENGTPVHIDFAPHESPGFGEVARIKEQFVANVYLEAKGDGYTTIFNRKWSAADEAKKIEGSYGYDDSVVAGAGFDTFAPSTGDLLIINTRNFHKVNPTNSPRLTYSVTFGLLDDNTLIFWS